MSQSHSVSCAVLYEVCTSLCCQLVYSMYITTVPLTDNLVIYFSHAMDFCCVIYELYWLYWPLSDTTVVYFRMKFIKKQPLFVIVDVSVSTEAFFGAVTKFIVQPTSNQSHRGLIWHKHVVVTVMTTALQHKHVVWCCVCRPDKADYGHYLSVEQGSPSVTRLLSLSLDGATH